MILRLIILLDELEDVTGLDFFTSLPDDMENELEGKKADGVWKW